MHVDCQKVIYIFHIFLAQGKKRTEITVRLVDHDDDDEMEDFFLFCRKKDFHFLSFYVLNLICARLYFFIFPLSE